MHSLFTGLVYLMFFLSGAAALMYQVVWVRSLSLIFGGSHLAVTAVLSVFMAGLAIGGYAIGRFIDRFKKPLQLYGLLELGIALFAVVFVFLMNVYPSIYIALAQGHEHAPLYLSFIRVLFAVIALIIPTTLMGGTLPVLSKFIANHPRDLGRHLSFLYGLNTLGAVAGAAAAGFFFLRFYSVSTTLTIAILINTGIGIASLLLQGKGTEIPASADPRKGEKAQSPRKPRIPEQASGTREDDLYPLRLVLWGIGISGFCALGYEVLWTRTLTIVVGATVYGFTTMLIAFLTGIALGSQAYGLALKLFPSSTLDRKRHFFGFGATQIMIGGSALVATFFIRGLTAHSLGLQNFFLGMGLEVFEARQWANFLLAFFYMVVPAFFMGLAFPLAGKLHAEYKKTVGSAVGEVLAYNTVGAILGAAASGFLMLYLFGIERSLQMLTIVNIGFGLLVIFSARKSKALQWGAPVLACAALLVIAFHPDAFRMWDRKYLAVFRNNQPEAFNTPEKIRDALENTDVLFYGEGVGATISSIKVKGGNQAVLVNGKIVASTQQEGQQCQLTLGHLPMLLHQRPRTVLVIGIGTGQTLGATSVHPSVEELTVVDIEPTVIGAARTFAAYNHHVLDNPKLTIIANDGRNFLMTTKEKYDVITADPIHPWAQGASYLYTTEYFRNASAHLLPGGFMCQWLPIYEMSVQDLKSVVKTFSEHFAYRMMWLTHNDAELIGSNDPIVIDEAELDQRIAAPPIADDLTGVMMGSAREFLSYFLMGTEGLNAFGRDGIVNTDDNLYLEFSTPLSVGINVMRTNVMALERYRETILPYLVRPRDRAARAEQERWWRANREAADVYRRAHALFLAGQFKTAEFRQYLDELDRNYPWFAPGRFIKNEYVNEMEKVPRLLRKSAFAALTMGGQTVTVEISAVLAPVSRERAAVVFVDNDARVVFGQRYFSGTNKEERIQRFVARVMADIQDAYSRETRAAVAAGRALPSLGTVMGSVRSVVADNVQNRVES